MHMCGCKLSSNAPFCDTVTCQKLMNGERINIAEAQMMSATSDEEGDEGTSSSSESSDESTEKPEEKK